MANKLSDGQWAKIKTMCDAHPGLTDREVAKLVGVSRTVVWKYRKSTVGQRDFRIPLTFERQVELLGAIQGGMTNKCIAARYHCSFGTITRIAKEAGISRRGNDRGCGF